MQSRAHAALLIYDVIHHRMSLSKVLEKGLTEKNNKQDNAFIKDLCYGVLRWYPQLEYYLGQLLNKPLRAKDTDIKILMLIGLYQLAYQRTADHAAVSATVDACTDLKKSWAKNMVNAVLRRFIREQIQSQPITEPEASTAHPSWLLNKFQQDWPDDWQQIIEANQTQAPLTLRINRQQISRDDYLAKLASQSITARACSHAKTGVILDKAQDVRSLPGYDRGEFSVQDEAAQLAAELLDIQTDHRVLDACAAPGGKTGHCLEQQPNMTELVALDSEPVRLNRLQQNLKRLSLSATLIEGDASTPEVWWDKQPFDRILLDVPCTASGIIRRHPDIKYLRQAEDLQNIQKIQKSILHNLWPLLKKGGKTVYSTCSIFKSENQDQIAGFLKNHPDAKLLPINSDWGHDTSFGKQILPGQDDMDGFFYSCIIKL